MPAVFAYMLKNRFKTNLFPNKTANRATSSMIFLVEPRSCNTKQVEILSLGCGLQFPSKKQTTYILSKQKGEVLSYRRIVFWSRFLWIALQR